MLELRKGRPRRRENRASVGAEGIKTATGKSKWHGPAIRRILAREMGDEAWTASKEAHKPEETAGILYTFYRQPMREAWQQARPAG